MTRIEKQSLAISCGILEGMLEILRLQDAQDINVPIKTMTRILSGLNSAIESNDVYRAALVEIMKVDAWSDKISQQVTMIAEQAIKEGDEK